jgi:phenylacetate-CoA ligase
VTIHDLLAKPYYAWRRYIPSRVLYHPDFFSVHDML